jgi:hypothetical protein
MLSFFTITHIIREKSDQKEDGSYEKIDINDTPWSSFHVAALFLWSRPARERILFQRS